MFHIVQRFINLQYNFSFASVSFKWVISFKHFVFEFVCFSFVSALSKIPVDF
jgi:hypothetical protein